MASKQDFRYFETLLKNIAGVNTQDEFNSAFEQYADFLKKEVNFTRAGETPTKFIERMGQVIKSGTTKWDSMDDFNKVGFDKLCEFGPEQFKVLMKTTSPTIIQKYSEKNAKGEYEALALISKPLKEGDIVKHPKLGVGFFTKFLNLDGKQTAIVKFKDKKYGWKELGTPVEPEQLTFVGSLASTSKSGILDPFQGELNLKIWDTSVEPPVVKKELKDKCLEVIEPFLIEYDVEAKGLLFYGGNAGYQYSENSDIDISLYIDWENNPSLIPQYEEMSKVCKNSCSFEYEGIEVHIFLKSPLEREMVEANENVYDIISETWIQEPKKFDVNPLEELAPFIEKGSLLVEKMHIAFNNLMSEIKNLKELGVEEIPKAQLMKFAPLVKMVKQLRTNRDIEHRNLRKKAIKGDEITFYDRATQNEVAWKLLSETKMLSKLDDIKDLLK